MSYFVNCIVFIETRPTLPPLSSSDVTTSDTNRNRRDTKTVPLPSNPIETDSNNSPSPTSAATPPNALATDKDARVQQQPRESGDGASAVGSDLIERSAAVTNEGRRVLSTARNGSLFDDEDDEDEDVANDNDTTNNANSTVQSLQGIATAAVAATTATTTNANSKKNITSVAE